MTDGIIASKEADNVIKGMLKGDVSNEDAYNALDGMLNAQRADEADDRPFDDE